MNHLLSLWQVKTCEKILQKIEEGTSKRKKRKKRKKDSDITSIALDGDIVISSDDIVISSNDTIVYTLMAKILLGQLILELHIISLVDVMSEWEMNPQLKLLALKMCVWILILSAGCGLTM